MEHDWILYIAAFASAFGISLVMTPYTKKLSFRFGAVTQPRERDMHSEAMPRLGGVAIILAFLLTSAIVAVFMPEFRTKESAGFAVGAVVIAALGIADDLKGGRLKAYIKLIVQLVVAVIVVMSGTRIEIVFYPITAYLESFSIPITILWVVGMTNAINLIDGLDGLAAGVSAIGALCLMALCALSGSPLAVALSATLAGSCLGFLPRNFNPAEVFMGDSGALFLGYVLAVSSIIGVFKGYTLLAVLVVFFAMALPIFDTLFAFIRRVVKGRSISAFMEADRGHMHHRLIDAGYSQKQSVFLLYGLSVVTAIIAVVIAVQDLRAILITVVSLLILLMVLFAYRRRTK
jgi:UDP-GlcNAc:undecaprenyl-phosphate GlcNAc-1-phosphate transferase